MPNANSPTRQWFNNLETLQNGMKNFNHLTANSLKGFSEQTLEQLILNDSIKGNLDRFCDDNKIGLVPTSAYSDMTKDFLWFLDKVGFIVISTSLRLQIYSIGVKHNPNLMNSTVAKVMQMSLDKVFGDKTLISNFGKKDLDVQLNDTTPDDFYPTDGSFLTDGSKKLKTLVKEIIS